MGPIVGHGVDVVELAEFERLLSMPGDHLVDRCFTDAEIAYAGNGPHRLQRLAARFAAKEAVLKSLCTGWVGGISWKDIEVVNEAVGRPSIKVTGEVARLAKSRCVDCFLVSMPLGRRVDSVNTPFTLTSLMAIRSVAHCSRSALVCRRLSNVSL